MSEDIVNALNAYIKAQGRLRDKWAEGDDAIKKNLWQQLHACEEPARAAISALQQPEGDVRERVARLISPDFWKDRDDYFEDTDINELWILAPSLQVADRLIAANLIRGD